MPTVNDVLRRKGHNLVTVDISSTALDAINVMNQHRVGAVVILDSEKLAGIFTERDVLTRVVAAGTDPRALPVRDVMTRDVICCEIFSDLDEIAQTMQERRVRHLPIRDDGRLVGMISIGDINAFHVQQKQAMIENMTDYICGRS